MGLYTIHDNPTVDQQIRCQINVIVGILTRNFPEIHSIILTGGFGKGEGSVKIFDGMVKPLRDFDIVVILKKPVSRKNVEMVKRLLVNDTNQTGNYKYAQEFCIDLTVGTLNTINLFPDITTYDMKNSKVIYGKDIRQLIRWDAKDIPLRSGARLLFQKSTALIGAFSLDYIKKDVPKNLLSVFMRETSKVYVEIGGALCILAGKYDSHCLKRVEILKEIYEQTFPNLFSLIPNLVEKIDLASKHKVNPTDYPIGQDPVDYWFTARDDLCNVIKYYLNEYLHFSAVDLIEFVCLLEKNLSKEYYVPLIDNYLSTKNLIKLKFLLRQFNYAYNIKQNIDYSMLSLRNQKFSVSLLKGFSAPCIKLFSACLLTLCSIERTGTADRAVLNEALKRLSFLKLNDNTFDNNWEEARLKCLNLIDMVQIL